MEEECTGSRGSVFCGGENICRKGRLAKVMMEGRRTGEDVEEKDRRGGGRDQGTGQALVCCPCSVGPDALQVVYPPVFASQQILAPTWAAVMVWSEVVYLVGRPLVDTAPVQGDLQLCIDTIHT